MTKTKKLLGKLRGKSFIIAAVLSVIFYALFFSSIYIQIIKAELKNSFAVISDFSLDNLDDDAIDSLDEIESKRVEVYIADENYEHIYSSHDSFRVFGENSKIENVDFQEQLRINYRGKKLLRSVWGNAKIVQNNKTYYLLMRKEVRSAYEIIRYSVFYFEAVLVILCLLFWTQLRKKEKDGSAVFAVGSVERMNQAEKEFIANVSHELKTPLSIISEQMEMIQLDDERIDKAAYFASIREEIEKMTDVVGNLLNLSKVEHDIDRMQMTDVNLTDLLEYMILKNSALLKQKNIQIETDILPKCNVCGNRMFLEQAVNNYIMNAIQHVPQGMSIRIVLFKEKTDAYIGVYNEGSSVPENAKEDIWKSYYSKTGKEQSDYHNAGLGLYLVKTIVEQHKGSCGCTNKDNGVEFWIRLPG